MRYAFIAVAASLLELDIAVAAPPAVTPGENTDERPSVERIEARIVAIQGADLVIDIGRARGLSPGDALVLWRPITLRHPVTRRTLTDRFVIGKVRLTQVQDVLSLARVEGEVARAPEAGDVVVGEGVAAVSPVRPGPQEPPPAVALPHTGTFEPTDPDAKAVGDLFDSLAGATVVERIRRYEGFATEHPGSRFALVLREEAMALRKLVQLHTRLEKDAPALAASAADPPSRALAGVPLSIAVDIEGGASGAVLHARHAGEVMFVSTPMVPAGPGYFVMTVPGDRVRAPRLEFFVEATTTEGQAVPVVGDARSPTSVRVDRIPSPAPPPDHIAEVTVLTDYADYNRLRGNDRVWQTEGQIGLRFGDTGVRAMRSGFGVYRGVGGSIAELDELHLDPRSVGLTYGYLEGEFAFASSWAFIGRAVLGLGDEGVSGGAQAHVRIGSDLGTNLTIGGEVLGGVGLRGITQLEFDPEGMVPIVLRSEVTNQPAGTSSEEPFLAPGAPLPETVERSEIGVRIIAQAGYRVLPPLVLSLRGSYQGRTINHAGPGVGGAVTYTW